VLPSYKRKANIAAAIWFIAMLALIPLSLAMPSGSNIWRDGNVFGQTIFLVLGGAWFYGLWAYLRAKGRSGLWAVLGIFTLIGLVIIAALPDKHKDAESE